MSFFSILKSWYKYLHSHPNRSSRWTYQQIKKWSCFTQNVHLKLNFQFQVHLSASCFRYILTICQKFLLFKSWARGIPIHIPILPAVQHGRISSWKYFLAVNVLFDSFNWKVNCMPLTCFICSLFNVNTFFFSS